CAWPATSCSSIAGASPSASRAPTPSARRWRSPDRCTEGTHRASQTYRGKSNPQQRRLAMQWTCRGAVLALLILLAGPAAALADGGPVLPFQGETIGVPGGRSSYGAFHARTATVVKRFGADRVPTGTQLRVAGQWGIPGVDYTGATTGLSASGRTLLLGAIPRVVPARTTRLLVLNTPRLTIRGRITLPGWFTVDAISPDGRWL